MEIDNTIVAMVCVTLLASVGLFMGVTNGLITASVAAIAGLAGTGALIRSKKGDN